MQAKVPEGIRLIREAIGVREEITEIYKQYRDLGDTACFAAGLKQADLKRAVDALYYFGGGWPSENSKGRMEALLENFVGMYRILDFIGEGHKVTKHLADFGITIKMAKEFKIENRDLDVNEKNFLNATYRSEHFTSSDLNTIKDLVSAVIEECRDLQSQICAKADKIKEELRPGAQNHLEIENEEYDRLHQIVRLTAKDTPRAKDAVVAKKCTINTSVTNFHVGLTALK